MEHDRLKLNTPAFARPDVGLTPTPSGIHSHDTSDGVTSRHVPTPTSRRVAEGSLSDGRTDGQSYDLNDQQRPDQRRLVDGDAAVEAR